MIFIVNIIRLEDGKMFKRKFDTEFERDKFLTRIKYSKKYKVLSKGIDTK